MLDKEKVLNNVAELKGLTGTRLSKYTRNYRLYESTRGISLDSLKSNNSVGFYKDSSNYDTTPDISLNVIKSCTDTLCSNIATVKVRPYFSTVNGTWKEVQTAKIAQRYFDQTFEYKNVNAEVVKAFKNACIFDTGVLYVNPKTKKIESVLPWQVYVRPSEATYNKITRVYYEQKQIASSLVDEYKGDNEYITVGHYYDIKNHVHALMIAETDTVIVESWDCEVLPFYFMHYSVPVLGTSSSSVADVLATIQVAINFLLNRYKDASQKNPAQTFFIPEGSNIEAYKLNNEVGNIITYATTSNMTSSPVTVSTPNFIDGQYLDGVERLKTLAYELVGLSQTSATGTKPRGLNSGIALETAENIENERFQMQQDMIIRCYKDIVRIFIEVMPKDENILETDMFTSSIKWSDIVDASRKLKIQYSAADQISKDPSVKIQMVQMLKNTGLCTDEMLLQQLELPDLDLSYSYMNNVFNGIQTVIDNCISKDKLDIPPFIPYNALMKEILDTCLILFSTNGVDNSESIMKLTKLFEVAYNKSKDLNKYVSGGQEE